MELPEVPFEATAACLETAFVQPPFGLKFSVVENQAAEILRPEQCLDQERDLAVEIRSLPAEDWRRRRKAAELSWG